MIGADQVPEHLRMQQLLDPYVEHKATQRDQRCM
ncbi:MAG: hypothetical protein ACI8XD_002085 [Thermoproteota archaeon]|jgi:hypothetical protein